MIYVNSILNKQFITNENEIPIIILENKKLYQDFILELNSQEITESIGNIFYINDKEIDISRDTDIITDIFNIDINVAKNLNKLYNFILSSSVNEEEYMKTLELTQNISTYITNIIQDIDFDLEFTDTIDIISIFKSMDLKFVQDGDSIVEKLIDYIKVMKRFFNKKLIVISNIKSVLSKGELEELYKFVLYEKVEVLIVEPREIEEKLRSEKYLIIDKDLCAIY